MAFCQYCGRELSEDEICTCRPPQPVSDLNIDPVPVVEGSAAAWKRYLKYACVLLPVLVILILLCSSSGYQRPIRQMVRGINRLDTEAVIKATRPADMIKAQKQELEDRGESWNSYIKASNLTLKTGVAAWTLLYGKRPKLSCKILDKRDATADEISTVSYYYTNTDCSITKVLALKVELAVSGSTGEETARGWLYVVKFRGGGWKVCANSLSAFSLLENLG